MLCLAADRWGVRTARQSVRFVGGGRKERGRGRSSVQIEDAVLGAHAAEPTRLRHARAGAAGQALALEAGLRFLPR